MIVFVEPRRILKPVRLFLSAVKTCVLVICPCYLNFNTMKHCVILFYFFCSLPAFSQPKTDSLLENMLLRNGTALMQHVLQQKDSFRLQIIYTQINRNRHNKPSFRNYYLNTDTNLYFNPASTVKLPLALLALEKLNNMGVDGVNKYAAMQIDSNCAKQTKALTDSTAESGFPSIAHYIKKAFLVSDNDAYNRLYQFVGQQTINRNLHNKGYQSMRITRQFFGFTAEENRHTNPVRFIHQDGRIIYEQPSAYNTDSFYFGKIIKIGKGHYNNRDSLINEPIDFTKVNNVPLEDLQQMLQSVLFPASVPARQRFNFKGDDYKFLYQYLSQYPSETNYPKYDSAAYYDSYIKFYFRDGNHQLPPYIRVFNKVGWAYGFLIDVSYVVDFKNKVEFMLTTTLYTNSDGILNDDKYDYKNIGWPFLYQLGQTVYQYELKRSRKYKPNLENFIVPYESRNGNDKRLTIKNVDN
ncbi:MAG: serine hydrolase [Ferruginibacter sp.]|nr:serine hydrolase [Ferruginibacter sp.]